MHTHYRKIIANPDGSTYLSPWWLPLAEVMHPAPGVSGGIVVLAVRYETEAGSDTPRAVGRLMYQCSDGYTSQAFDALLGTEGSS